MAANLAELLGVDEGTAATYLEMTGGDVDAAVTLYFSMMDDGRDDGDGGNPRSTTSDSRSARAAPATCSHPEGLDDSTVMQMWSQLGTAGQQLQVRDCQAAIGKYEEMSALLEHISDSKHRQSATNFTAIFLGNAYAELGQYDKAIGYYNQVVAIARETKDRQNESNYLGRAGMAYLKAGQFHAAVEHCAQALGIAREIGDRQGEGNWLGSLGNAYESLGQHNKAIEHYSQGLTVAREAGYRQGECNWLGSLGNAYRSIGHYGKAIQHHNKALAISREIGDRCGESSHISNLGQVYFCLGQHDKAIEHQNGALTLSRQLGGDRQGEANKLGSLGDAYDSLGQHDKAIEHFTEALTIFREIGDTRGQSIRLGSLATVSLRLGQNRDAIEKLNEALAIAREIGDRHNEGSFLGTLGSAYLRQEKNKEAIAHYTEALAISREVGDQQGEGLWLGNVGSAYLGFLSDAAAALPFLVDAVKIFDGIWDNLETDRDRITFGDVQAPKNASKLLQVAHVQLSNPQAALETAEHARSRAFELLLAGQRLGQPQPQPSQDRQAGSESAPSSSSSSSPSSSHLSWGDMVAIAAKQRACIVYYSLVSPSELHIGVIASSGPSSGGCETATAAGPTAFESVRLDANDARELVSLVEATRRVIGAQSRSAVERSKPTAAAPVALRTTATAAALSRDKATAETPAHVEARIESVAKPGEGEAVLLRRCYDLLVAPIASHLVNEQHLLLIPDGHLFALPFAALTGPDGKYLIQRFSLRVAPSLGTLSELAARREANQPVGLQAMPAKAASRIGYATDGAAAALVVGDPDFHGYLPQLPAARREAEVISKGPLSKQQHGSRAIAVECLTFADATKQRVVDAIANTDTGPGSLDVAHLATHGSPDGLYFAASAGDGEVEASSLRLTTPEVHGLRLKARLVVLSACDTFKGELRSDGVVGITRAFLAAGAESLVASLWKVNDASTLELMWRFYHYRCYSGDNVAVAMQHAMCSMIAEKDFAGWRGKFSVLDWAGFVVYGASGGHSEAVSVSSMPLPPAIPEDDREEEADVEDNHANEGGGTGGGDDDDDDDDDDGDEGGDGESLSEEDPTDLDISVARRVVEACGSHIGEEPGSDELVSRLVKILEDNATEKPRNAKVRRLRPKKNEKHRALLERDPSVQKLLELAGFEPVGRDGDLLLDPSLVDAALLNRVAAVAEALRRARCHGTRGCFSWPLSKRSSSSRRSGRRARAEAEAAARRPSSSPDAYVSVFTPTGGVAPGVDFGIEIWAYLREQIADIVEEQRAQERSAGSSGRNVPLVDGARVTVTLRLPESAFRTHGPMDSFVWGRTPACAQFLLSCLPTAEGKRHFGHALVECEGVDFAAEVMFSILVAAPTTAAAAATVEQGASFEDSTQGVTPLRCAFGVTGHGALLQGRVQKKRKYRAGFSDQAFSLFPGRLEYSKREGDARPTTVPITRNTQFEAESEAEVLIEFFGESGDGYNFRYEDCLFRFEAAAERKSFLESLQVAVQAQRAEYEQKAEARQHVLRDLEARRRSEGVTRAGAVSLSEPAGRWDFFISHTQRNPEGKLMALDLHDTLRDRGFRCWLDVKMDYMNMASMEAGVRGSKCVLAVITGPCPNADYPNEKEDANAYFGRWMCCQELLWAADEGVPVIPVIRAEDKKKIGGMVAITHGDIRTHDRCSVLKTAIGKIDFVHADRSTKEDWNFGVGKILNRFLEKKAMKLELAAPPSSLSSTPLGSAGGDRVPG